MSKLDPFGKHKREIWQELCEHIPATFFKGKWNKPDRVEASHGNWMITLDSFSVDSSQFTRIRAPYVNRDDFTFRIFRQMGIHKLDKLLGMKDLEVGYPEFDREFIIQGSDQRKLKMMFANPNIRALIRFQPKILFKLRPDMPLFQKKFPKDINEVYFHCGGIVRNLEQLQDLYDLFSLTLDHLCAIGTAYKDDPNFAYY